MSRNFFAECTWNTRCNGNAYCFLYFLQPVFTYLWKIFLWQSPPFQHAASQYNNLILNFSSNVLWTILAVLYCSIGHHWMVLNADIQFQQLFHQTNKSLRNISHLGAWSDLSEWRFLFKACVTTQENLGFKFQFNRLNSLDTRRDYVFCNCL